MVFLTFNKHCQQTSQFVKITNIFCVVPLAVEFLLPVLFFTTDAIRFHCFLYEVKQDNVSYNRALFFQQYISQLLILLYYLIQALILIISLKFYLFRFLSRLFYMQKYFIDSTINIKVFFVRINSNKLTIQFLFYCFLSFYFVVNVSVTVPIFFHFYCRLIVKKIKVNPLT